ncbi:hypothetical protein [Actinospica durhamensis]|nr:hypothetical protein [Actinospica durhamensis]
MGGIATTTAHASASGSDVACAACLGGAPTTSEAAFQVVSF